MGQKYQIFFMVPRWIFLECGYCMYINWHPNFDVDMYLSALIWKLLIEQSDMYVYTVQFGIHFLKARGHSKVMVDFTENLLYSLFY